VASPQVQRAQERVGSGGHVDVGLPADVQLFPLILSVDHGNSCVVVNVYVYVACLTNNDL
jgi:hypothetical protein